MMARYIKANGKEVDFMDLENSQILGKKHILDFDALFRNIILQKNKGEKSQNKKRNNSGIHSKNKFVGSKRIRNVSNKSINTKSKFLLLYLFSLI